MENINFSIKQLFPSGSKPRKVYDLLTEHEEKTFSEIAKIAGLKVAKVYEINSLIEEQKILSDQIRREEEKAERVLQKMKEGEERRKELEIRTIEQLHFEEGLTPIEISEITDLDANKVRTIIRKIKKQGAE